MSSVAQYFMMCLYNSWSSKLPHVASSCDINTKKIMEWLILKKVEKISLQIEYLGTQTKVIKNKSSREMQGFPYWLSYKRKFDLMQHFIHILKEKKHCEIYDFFITLFFGWTSLWLKNITLFFVEHLSGVDEPKFFHN